MDLGDPKLIPVIIGCGQINDRAATGAQGLDSLQLMIASIRAASKDAGNDVVIQTDWLGIVNQASFPNLTGTLVDEISKALKIQPKFARETSTPTGDSPILLINEAANAIGRGEAQVAVIVGAEALRTSAMRRAESATDSSAKDLTKSGPYPQRKPRIFEPRHEFGLNTPTDIYPMFENAARAALGQTIADAQAETGLIWSNMSEVAAANPNAWIQQLRSAQDIITPSEKNRPIAFPYTKFQVANAAVNQGAAVIVTSLAVARSAGVPDQRIVYVGRGAAAHEDDNPLMRPDYASSSSMVVSLTQALKLNALKVDDLDYLELYSCFPIIPKLARRVLGVPANQQMTVFGGLTFGGGPIGNYMTHAAASLVGALRRSGTNGLLFANGGYATHNHTIILTKTPQLAGTFPHDFDFQKHADALRGTIPRMIREYEGPATLETYTVQYRRNGEPKQGVIVVRIDDTTRTMARVPASNKTAIDRLENAATGLIGASGHVNHEDDRNIWSFD